MKGEKRIWQIGETERAKGMGKKLMKRQKLRRKKISTDCDLIRDRTGNEKLWLSILNMGGIVMGRQ